MAPVYDFRHVELDKIGRGKRIVKPPGGECSDIFGTSSAGEPKAQSTPRKTNNYMQSTIFGANGQATTPPSNGHTPKKVEDTQERLFGAASEEETTPKKVVDRLKSKIFEDEVDSGIYSPKSTPVRRPSINPITGEPLGDTSMHDETNGHTNGTTNGHSTPVSPTNGSVVQRVRVPPGGPSSGIF